SRYHKISAVLLKYPPNQLLRRSCRSPRSQPRNTSSSGEIRLTDVRIVDQLAPASLDRNRTRFQEIGVIAHVERGRGILLHHENGRTGRTNVGDNVEATLDDRASQPGR